MQDDFIQRIEINQYIKDFIRTTQAAVQSLERDPYLLFSVTKAVDAICALDKGKLITTGLGKAGHAAEKSSSSFSSLGIPSCYLHPAQASHGDSGIIQHGDVMLAFSNSGKTREVIETIRLARQLGIHKVISITSHEESTIRYLSDVVIEMGIVKEAGYLSMAPTTSVLIMLMIADIVATLCAFQKGLTLQQFGLRHHSGYLGELSREKNEKENC